MAKKEINCGEPLDAVAISSSGGGRKKIETTQIAIMAAIERLVSNHTFGNPENPLRWTTKSLRNIAEELTKQGFKVNHQTIHRLLNELGYSQQVNRKFLQIGTPHPDAGKQIEFIDARAIEFMSKYQPVISIDTKKISEISGIMALNILAEDVIQQNLRLKASADGGIMTVVQDIQMLQKCSSHVTVEEVTPVLFEGGNLLI
jgi:hypothetical protein